MTRNPFAFWTRHVNMDLIEPKAEGYEEAQFEIESVESRDPAVLVVRRIA